MIVTNNTMAAPSITSDFLFDQLYHFFVKKEIDFRLTYARADATLHYIPLHGEQWKAFQAFLEERIKTHHVTSEEVKLTEALKTAERDVEEATKKLDTAGSAKRKDFTKENEEAFYRAYDDLKTKQSHYNDVSKLVCETKLLLDPIKSMLRFVCSSTKYKFATGKSCATMFGDYVSTSY